MLIPTEQLRRKHALALESARGSTAEVKAAAAMLVYDAVMSVSGASLEGISLECGRSKNAARRWADPTHRSLPNIADIVMMDPAVALQILRWLTAAHGLGLHDLPHTEPGSNVEAMTGLVRSSSALTPDVVEALADGRVDATEARELRPAIVEVFEAAASALASVDAILEEDQ